MACYASNWNLNTRLTNLKISGFVVLLAFVLSAIFVDVINADEQDNFYFDPSPMDQDVIDGAEARLRCDVSNRKMINFYWTMNGKQLTNTARRFQEDSDLRFLKVDRVQDSGSFRCVATNYSTGMALRSTEAKLNIFWLDDSAEIQPKPNKEGEALPEGSEVTMKCQADGNPEPAVEWFKNKIRIYPNERLKVSKNRLKLTGAIASDNGIYSCKARNVAGMRESTNSYLLNTQGSDTARLNVTSFTRILLVKKKATAIFHCEYTNAVNIEWHFNEIRISNGSEKYTVMDNGTLIINQVSEDDVGVYRCVGVSRRGPVQNFASELFLAYLDGLTDESFEPRRLLTPVVIPVNGKLEVLCHPPRGLPSPSLRWLGPNMNVIADQEKIKVIEGTLTINNAEESHSGNYTCISENIAGSTNKSIQVVVSIPPVISRSPISTRVLEDDSARFDCKVTATPYPVTIITWTFDDEPINTNEHIVEIDEVAGSLKIPQVTLNDEGNYACIVNTSGHQAILSTNAHLYVEKRLKFKPVPTNTKLELGSNSRIICRADGRIPPKMKWSRGGEASFPSHVQDVDGVLLFKGVQQTDVGQYTCIASSEQGVINVTILVDVIVKPKFKVKPVNTTALEGHSIVLHCVAVGDPPPTIQWDKNNKVNSFDFQRFKVLNNGSLSVSEVYMEDVGKYGCTAGNSGGFERVEVYLHVTNTEGYQRMLGDGVDKAQYAESFDMMKTITIAVCSAVAYLAIVIGLTVYCSIRLIRAKNLRKHNLDTTPADNSGSGENGNIISENTELVAKKDNNTIGRNDFDARSASSVGIFNNHSMSGTRPLLPPRSLDRLSFQRHRLQTLGMLGRGLYGDVFLAKTRIGDGDLDTVVMVKSLLSRTDVHMEECRREIELFSRLNHEHIVRLLGLCKDVEPLFVITEYCEWGDLKKFLLATREDTALQTIPLPPLTLSQKITMCGQVALGMEHLSNNGLVHRDLAARNILLSPTLDLKISSLSLCRDVYANEYFHLHKRLIPLRWMSPEAILDEDYSSESDVWSFGIFAWEVFTSGDMPLDQKTNEQVLEGLNSRENRLNFPAGCPNDMWSLIQTCVVDNPDERPSFSDLVNLMYDLTYDTVNSS